MHHLDLRQRDLEGAIEAVQGAVTRTKSDVEQHDDRLRELERRIVELGDEGAVQGTAVRVAAGFGAAVPGLA
jgi:hypothetical protein